MTDPRKKGAIPLSMTKTRKKNQTLGLHPAQRPGRLRTSYCANRLVSTRPSPGGAKHWYSECVVGFGAVVSRGHATRMANSFFDHQDMAPPILDDMDE